MKKIGTGSWIACASAVIALISLIVFQVSVKTAQGYYDSTYAGTTVTLFVLGIVLILCSIVTGFIKGDAKFRRILKIVGTVLTIGACMCFGYVIGTMANAIVNEFAYTYFSDFNIGTVKETFIPQALSQSIAAIVLAAVAMITAAVSGGFKKAAE